MLPVVSRRAVTSRAFGTRSRRHGAALVAAAVGVIGFSGFDEAAVTISTASTFTQNFNDFTGLATAPTNWTSASATSQTARGSFTFGSTSTTGGVFALKPTAASADAAFGLKMNASDNPFTLTQQIVNGTGSAISGFNLSWNNKQYTVGGKNPQIYFQYSTDGTTYTQSGLAYTAGASTFTAQANAAVTTLSVISTGSLTSNVGVLSLGSNITASGSLFVRFTWTIGSSGSGNNSHIAIDDFSIAPILVAGAGNYAWDADGTSPVNGGSGTWDTSAARFSPDSGASYSAWNNAAFNNAVFGGTAGTVTLATTIAAGGLTFNTDGYTLTGGTLQLGGTTPTVTVSAPAGAGTIASNITGSAGLTVSNTGTLYLTGSNSYTGGTNISAGTLAIASDSNLGDPAGTVTFTGNLATTTNLTLPNTRPLVATGGSLAPITGTTLTYNGAISGTNFGKAGGGVLILGGTNAYTGSTSVSEGTLKLGNVNAIPANSTVGIAGGAIDTGGLSPTFTNMSLGGGTINTGSGTLSLIGSSTTSATAATPSYFYGNVAGSPTTTSAVGFTLAHSATLGSLPDIDFEATISGTRRFNFSGTGSVLLNADNSAFTAGFSTSGVPATIVIGNKNALGAPSASLLVTSGSLYIPSALTGANAIQNGVLLGGTLSIDGAPVEFAGTNSFATSGAGNAVRNLVITNTTTVSEPINDNGTFTALTKRGTGTFVINGSGNATGSLQIVTGTVAFGPNGSLASLPSILMDSATFSTNLLIQNATPFSSSMPINLNAGSTGLGGTVSLDGGGVTGVSTTLGAITLTGNAGSSKPNVDFNVINSIDTLTVSSITDSQTITTVGAKVSKDGPGLLIISGAQTHKSGSTFFVNAGTATVNSDGGTFLAATVAPSAVLNFGIGQTDKSITNSGSVNFNTGDSSLGFIVGSTATGAGTVTVASGLTLLTTGTFSQNVLANSGSVSIGGGVSGINSVSGAGTFIVASPATVTVSSSFAQPTVSNAGSLNLLSAVTSISDIGGGGSLGVGASAAVTVTNSFAQATLNNAGSVVFSGMTNTVGSVGGAGAIGVGAAASLNVSNGMAQGIVTNAGNLNLLGGTSNLGTLGGAGALSVASGATLNVSSSLNHGAVASNGNINLSGGAANLVGAISGVGTLATSGGANLTTTSIRQGGLSVGPASTVTVAYDSQAHTGGTPIGTSVVTTLSVDSAGTLDLKNNGIVILDTTSLGAVQSLITQAADVVNGVPHWDMPGITSSSAAGDPGHAVGYALASTLPNGGSTSFNGITFSDAVIARYTLVGDTGLKGTVDLSDYTKVVLNLGKSNALWSDGNFDYSGNVNLGDYTAVIRNLGRSDGQSTVFNATGPSAQQVKASALSLHAAPAVTQASTATDVTLLVNPTNGRVTLVNALQTGQAVITAYTINSPSQSLLPFSADGGGKYLANALENNPSVFYKASNGLTYNLWTGIKNVSTFIGEGFSNHYNANVDSTWTNYTLATTGYALGTLFKRLSSGGTKDLVFQWEDANLNTYTSVVTYVGAVPEPGSVSLIAAGAMAMLGRRRRSRSVK